MRCGRIAARHDDEDHEDDNVTANSTETTPMSGG